LEGGQPSRRCADRISYLYALALLTVYALFLPLGGYERMMEGKYRAFLLLSLGYVPPTTGACRAGTPHPAPCRPSSSAKASGERCGTDTCTAADGGTCRLLGECCLLRLAPGDAAYLERRGDRLCGTLPDPADAAALAALLRALWSRDTVRYLKSSVDRMLTLAHR